MKSSPKELAAGAGMPGLAGCPMGERAGAALKELEHALPKQMLHAASKLEKPEHRARAQLARGGMPRKGSSLRKKPREPRGLCWAAGRLGGGGLASLQRAEAIVLAAKNTSANFRI